MKLFLSDLLLNDPIFPGAVVKVSGGEGMGMGVSIGCGFFSNSLRLFY